MRHLSVTQVLAGSTPARPSLPPPASSAGRSVECSRCPRFRPSGWCYCERLAAGALCLLRAKVAARPVKSLLRHGEFDSLNRYFALVVRMASLSSEGRCQSGSTPDGCTWPFSRGNEVKEYRDIMSRVSTVGTLIATQRFGVRPPDAAPCSRRRTRYRLS